MTSLLQLGCAVCFGDPSSPQGHAMRLAITFLLAVIVSVLVSIALVARSWAVRARALDQREHDQAQAPLDQAAPALSFAASA